MNKILEKREKVFFLMNRDREILKFKVSNSLLNPIEIVEKYVEDRFIGDLGVWINNRVIPTNRQHIEKVLETVNLKNPRPIDILEINHACSLNDTLWIKEDGEKNIYGKDLTWKDVSLYKGFKEALGIVSFFGNTSSLGGNLKTPELTTNGMLGKAWRIVDGEIKLYKKGTSGGCNTGNEPWSELMASEILKNTSLDYIKYTVDSWEDTLCSVCKLYTSEDVGYISMKDLLRVEVGNNVEWTYSIVLELCKKYNVEKELKEMLLFDYIIINQDRHFGNFGFTINNETRKIIGFMPFFDHGYSLGNFMLSENEIDEKIIEQGTFNNTRLIDQGKEMYREKFAKTIIKDINTNINKLKELDIPKERIYIAINIVKKTIQYLSEYN